MTDSTTTTTTTTSQTQDEKDSNSRPPYLNADGTYHIQTAAERKAEEAKKAAEQLRIISEHRKVFSTAYYNPYIKRDVKMDPTGPWATIYNSKKNPDEFERNRAVKFIKALWTNVKRFNYKDENNATRKKYRTLSMMALGYKLGHVQGYIEVLEALGFKKNEDETLLQMDIDDNLETGYKVMWELDAWVKKYPYTHKWAAGEVVQDFLWIGDKEDAHDKVQLKSHKITHILNCTDNVPNFFEKSSDFKVAYKKLDIADFGKDDGIQRVFPDAIEFVGEAKNERGRVFVHCYTGMNRSVTVLAAVLMDLENITLQVALQKIQSVYRNAAPFQDNRDKLLEYERKTMGSNSMVLGDFPTHDNYYKKIKAQQKARFDEDEAYLKPLREAQERARKDMAKYSSRYFTSAYEYLTPEQRATMARNHQKINKENEEIRKKMERPKDDLDLLPKTGTEEEKY